MMSYNYDDTELSLSLRQIIEEYNYVCPSLTGRSSSFSYPYVATTLIEIVLKKITLHLAGKYKTIHNLTALRDAKQIFKSKT